MKTKRTFTHAEGHVSMNDKTLVRQLAHMIPLVLIGLTLWVVWLFVTGDIGHPMWFLSSFAAGPHEFIITPFKLFASVPTLEAHGIMVLYLWPMYYLTGMMLYLVAGALLVEVANFLLHGVDVGFRAAWEEREARQKAHDVYARRVVRLQKRAAASAKAAGAPAGSQGWSCGAIVFGVFLGWLLFN